MAIEVLTLDELIVNAKAAIRSRFPTRATHDESWLGKTANALATLLWSLHDKVQQADHDAIPQEDSSYDALAAWAYALGLSDGDSGYGALQATEALGLTLTLTGTPATVVWNGLGTSPEWVAADGETTFELTAAATIGGGGTVSVTMNATVAGTDGNLSVGDVVTLTSSIPGVDASATVTAAAATEGTDDEAIGALLTRVLYRLQHQPKAITASDLRTIAEGVTLSSVTVSRAYVYPRRSGTGTADVVPMVAGSGSGRRPSAALVTEVDGTLDDDRTVTAESTNAIRPTPSSGSAIKVRGTASGAYPWDWDSSTGGPWTIDTVVDTTHLKMNTALPADFKAAVDAGNKPRIQIKQTGSVLPVIHRCIAPWSDSGGKTTVTLETAYTTATAERTTVAAPTVGDEVHAGASFVWDIANDLLDYVDGLGPSKASGFADANDSWDDTIVIDQLRRVALDAADANGVRYLKKMATTSTPTVDGAAADLQATDTGAAIEYLIASSVLVVP